MTQIAALTANNSSASSFTSYSFMAALQPAPHHPSYVKEYTAPTLDEHAPSDSKRKGRPAKIQLNRIKPYLSCFSAPGYALHSLPQLDAIVTGAVNLDHGGNTRPFSKKLVLSMLRSLDTISTANVEAYMESTLQECSNRHAKRIALCLRVIENAATKLSNTVWPALDSLQELEGSSLAIGITPCGNPLCSVCSNWQLGKYASVFDQSPALTDDCPAIPLANGPLAMHFGDDVLAF
ncbi:hypothetical protein [Pseudoduganella lutea]|uniref:Uncharacterized protein n=1 Tax=Pseudoduganella lutea TaxID=321985 RepID=A0A4P6KYJ5_9BURK|nr:hypothetical protein [Pseudoduganella lutea]QBE64279.1 hypothetical protein EWM63_15850 [Pseudoduganella lutea]